MKKQYGLIGYPLSHSFSKRYFADKFLAEGITNSKYDLFELQEIKEVENLFAMEDLMGFNVTIPYKHQIMDFMDNFDDSAKKVGAVNVVKINKDGSKTGYNSDYYGFRVSLEKWIEDFTGIKAMILGVGGAAKAVLAVLEDLSIPYVKISRDNVKGDFTYEDIAKNGNLLLQHRLIINTTPLGMSPNTAAKPALNYDQIGEDHFLYDLIYNPAKTSFLEAGASRGAQIKNGLEMLRLQAEKSWDIWTNY